MPKVVNSDERRFTLAAAAARVVSRSGIGSVTLRAVAAEAGLTTGALTHYFSDKQQLLRFTLEASLDRRRSLRPERLKLSPDEALRNTLLHALPLDEESRLHWTVTVAFCAHASGDSELAVIQRDAYRDFRSNVARLVRLCKRASGKAAVAEAERLIAIVDGIAMQALFDPESWSAGRQVRALNEGLYAPGLVGDQRPRAASRSTEVSKRFTSSAST
jgi:AcrR family transcriptional regulator